MNNYFKDCLAHCHEWLIGGTGEIYSNALGYNYCRDIHIAHAGEGRWNYVFFENYHMVMTDDGYLCISSMTADDSILTTRIDTLDEFRQFISCLYNMSRGTYGYSDTTEVMERIEDRHNEAAYITADNDLYNDHLFTFANRYEK